MELRLRDLSVAFGSKTVLENVNLSVPSEKILCLLGPSGSGKSTLLRVMAGLLPTSAGHVEWAGDSTAVPPRTAFVFQEPQLLPWRNVFENCQLPLEFNRGLSKDQQIARVQQSLRTVGLQDAAPAYPHQLSGGMKMRVSLARALAVEPQMLFMDEPFAALDEVSRFRLQQELRALSEAYRLTIVFVTHSIYEAAYLADRIVMLSRQPRARILFDDVVAYNQTRNADLRNHLSYLDCTRRLSQQMAEAAR
jgi:NitT/TauT family transport system ATP-binding protein